MRTRIRSTVGPLCVALGAYAAASSLAPASLDNPQLRLVSPASPFWAMAGFAAAACVAPLRRFPLLSTTALLPVILWLPIPLPHVAYIWTGRLAWLTVALPFLGAMLARRRAAERPDRGPIEESPGAGPWLAGALTLLVLSATAVSIGDVLPGGDEPHYLVITQSLLIDGDLKIENNHTNRDYTAYHPGQIAPHFIQRSTSGEVYSIHAPGVPLLVAPAFAAFGYRGAQGTVMILAAATGGLLWLAAWLVARERRAAWLAWLSVAGSTTFLVQGVTIFPDGPAAFVSAVAVVVCLVLSRGMQVRASYILGLATVLTALPFLHSRFASLAGLLGAITAWQILVTRSEPVCRQRLRHLGLLIAPAVAGLICWLGYFWLIYGTVDPRAPYGSTREFSATYAPVGFLGILLDQQFGLLAYFPIAALAVVGLLLARGEKTARWLLAAGVAYCVLAAFYWMWWAGGPAPPARLATAALPLLAAPIALAWRRAEGSTRAFFVVLLIASLAITTIVVFAAGDSLFANFRTGRARWLDWLGTAADLPRLWPSFFWRLDPARLETEWPFVISASVWVATFVLSFLVLRRLVTSRSEALAAMAAIWWLPSSIMVAGGLVARLDGQSGLRPAEAQISVLARAAARYPVFVVRPGSVYRMIGLPPLTIQVPRIELPGSTRAEWLTLPGMPAGQYVVRIKSRRPRGGRLTIAAGRVPQATFTLAPRSIESFPLTLLSPVTSLSFAGDEIAREGVSSIDLEPQSRLSTVE